jgi:hypothetical protein
MPLTRRFPERTEHHTGMNHGVFDGRESSAPGLTGPATKQRFTRRRFMTPEA